MLKGLARHTLRALLGAVVPAIGVGVSRLPAQTPTVDPVSAIAAAEIAADVAMLADDSMLGRGTPSRELDLAAHYVTSRFQQLGLKVEVIDYPLPGQLKPDLAASHLQFSFLLRNQKGEVVDGDGELVNRRTLVDFAADAIFPADGPPVRQSGGGTFSGGGWGLAMRSEPVLVAGRHTPATLGKATWRGKVVVYVPPPGVDPAVRQELVGELCRDSRAVVIVTDDDSAAFAASRRAALTRPAVVLDDFMADGSSGCLWAAQVRADTVERILALAGVDVPGARADTAPVIRSLLPVGITLDIQFDSTGRAATAPDVIATLEGSDSLLRSQFVVFVAHLDGGGLARGQADSIENGANDGASGVAGLLALARAFSAPGARPRRSMKFLAVSGGRGQQSGSRFAVQHSGTPLQQLSAVIALDMIGRGPAGSIVVDGLRDAEWLQRPDWLAAQHPELGLTVIDGGPASRPTADHFPFVKGGVPSLFFHLGTHESPPSGADTPGAVDAEQEARTLGLVFHVGRAIGNADRRPKWSREGREARLRSVEP